MLELLGVLQSELGESSFVSDDSLGSHVVDLLLSNNDPVVVESLPFTNMVVEDLLSVHDM